MKLAPLLLCLAALVAASAAPKRFSRQDETPVKSPDQFALGLFKNGLAVGSPKLRAPKPGQIHNRDPLRPIHGTVDRPLASRCELSGETRKLELRT